MKTPQTRKTRQRMIILDTLRKVKTHPTADEIYDMVRTQLPRISLGTVYRNLDFLAASGDVLKLESAGSIKRFDGDMSPHQHVRCSQCGRVGDVMQGLPVPVASGIEAPGFTIKGARVEFDGICDDCAAEKQISMAV